MSEPQTPSGQQNQPVDPSPETPLKRGVSKLAAQGTAQSTEILAMMTGSLNSNPLHNKMTEEHVTQVLTLAEKHDEREYELSKREQDKDSTEELHRKVLYVIFFGGMLATVVFIILVFRSQPTVLAPILTGLGGAVAGFIGGLGYGRR